MEFVMDCYCGLYCGACTMMLGTEPGITQKCYGCKSEAPASHCAECVIKACAISKGFDFCSQCAELGTCEKIQHFIHDPQYQNGLAVMKNFADIQQVGLQQWLVDQEKRWRCANCGAQHSWWDEVCPQCGSQVKSYKADIQAAE